MKRILWFRVTDNPLLSLGGEVLPIFIFDTHILGSLPKNDRRVSYIYHHVILLKKALKENGLDLKVFYGDPVDIFKTLEKEGFHEVAASGDYDAYAKKRDIQVSMIMPFNYLHDTYIFKPNEILKDNGMPYLLFTPYYKKAKSLFTQKHLKEHKMVGQTLLEATYKNITQVKESMLKALPLSLASLGFENNMPELPICEEKLSALSEKLEAYAHERDYPVLDATSNLSLELRFGVLGIRELLRFLVEEKKHGIDTEPFFRQLVFRDFYAYLLHYFPDLTWKNYKYRFEGIPDETKFSLFCSAKTGVPIVDAGIRQLLETGQMHNRVRMICASFLTKDLLLPWQWGEKFFAKHLLDYDAASNILSWQWSAGTGIDPQPYFRIFNPWLQAKKFDKDGTYIKRWLPELASLTPKLLHDEAYMHSHTLPDYPHPVVHHKEAARDALKYFKNVQ